MEIPEDVSLVGKCRFSSSPSAARKAGGTAHSRPERAGHRSAAPAAPSVRTPPEGGGPAAGWEAQRKAWEARYAKARERPDLYPFTISGIPIKPLYTPEDLAGMDLPRDLGFPGEFPYTRGIRDNMYRGRMFTMRQFSGFAGPRESNRRYHSLLAHGQTGL